jgi:hypothetical protein
MRLGGIQFYLEFWRTSLSLRRIEPGFLDIPPCNPADNDGVSLLVQNVITTITTTTTTTQNCLTDQQRT